MMTGYNFTERVRLVLGMSRETADKLRHEYVAPEHMLLALINEGGSVAVAVLRNLNVDLNALQKSVKANMKVGRHDNGGFGPDLPYTSRAKKVLELTMSEARDLHHSYVGCEHLLLGILREKMNIAAYALTEAGVSLDAARTETLQILGSAEVPPNGTAVPSRPNGTLDGPRAVITALHHAPEIVVPLVREVPEHILKRRPAPGKWSAHEHACHLAHVHAMFFERLEIMLRDPAPVIKPYQPGEQDPDDLLMEMDLDDAMHRYTADRAKLVYELAQLSATDWARTAQHAEYRTYSVFIMFRHLAMHDFLHAYRIEELLLRPDW